jgi:hypothetical protein
MTCPKCHKEVVEHVMTDIKVIYNTPISSEPFTVNVPVYTCCEQSFLNNWEVAAKLNDLRIKRSN